mmetsp:Transcript_36355/g.104697  ORF Transcript_36355/g.104697 Transcript_36355/m.104697 type:complete len:210 (+) Transcript_36355:136-765(+)
MPAIATDLSKTRSQAGAGTRRMAGISSSPDGRGRRQATPAGTNVFMPLVDLPSGPVRRTSLVHLPSSHRSTICVSSIFPSISRTTVVRTTLFDELVACFLIAVFFDFLGPALTFPTSWPFSSPVFACSSGEAPSPVFLLWSACSTPAASPVLPERLFDFLGLAFLSVPSLPSSALASACSVPLFVPSSALFACSVDESAVPTLSLDDAS